jgi:hypothetical protein
MLDEREPGRLPERLGMPEQQTAVGERLVEPRLSAADLRGKNRDVLTEDDVVTRPRRASGSGSLPNTPRLMSSFRRKCDPSGRKYRRSRSPSTLRSARVEYTPSLAASSTSVLTSVPTISNVQSGYIRCNPMSHSVSAIEYASSPLEHPALQMRRVGFGLPARSARSTGRMRRRSN